MKNIYMLIILLSMTSCYSTYSPQAADATKTLKSNADSFSLSVSIKPKTTKYGLRSVLLCVPMFLCGGRPYQWPDGTLASGSARISEGNAINAIEDLADLGFFDYAGKHYSERTPVTKDTPPPPKDAQEFGKRKKFNVESPSVSIGISFHDDYWYTCYQATLPWDEEARAALVSIRNSLSYFGEGRRLINELIEQMDDSQ